MKAPIRFAALMLCALLLFAGCGPKPDGKITSVKYSSETSDPAACWSYSLEERADGVFFSCDAPDFAAFAEGERIRLDAVPVEDAVMESFRAMAEQNAIASSVIKSRGTESGRKVSVELNWENGGRRTARRSLENEGAMLRFFRSVAEYASKEPITAPEGQLLAYRIEVFSAAEGGDYSISVSESGGRVLISGSFTDTVQTTDGYWDAKRIEVEDAPVSDEDWARIRDAAVQTGLGERLAEMSRRWKSGAAAESEVIYDITARWEFGVALSESGAGEPPKDALYEALTDALRRAAS